MKILTMVTVVTVARGIAVEVLDQQRTCPPGTHTGLLTIVTIMKIMTEVTLVTLMTVACLEHTGGH